MKRIIRVSLVRTLVVLCCVSLLQTLVPISTMAQQFTPDAATSFELGESPLSEPEMDQLMLWIAAEVGAARVPYCYRQSDTRGAGNSMTCSPGYVQEGGFCFTPCKTDERGIDDLCYKNCPAGFRDDGLYCGKPAAYSRGAGYVIWDKAKCEKDNPQGCEQGGAIWYPKCRAGFTGVVTQCSVTCPAGFQDIGVSCKKPTNKRGSRYLTDCSAGLEKSGALCYPPCKNPNYTGIGPVCWQNCPSQHPTPCGVGCATTGLECGSTTFSMVLAPFIAVISLASLGTAGAAASSARAAKMSPAQVKAAVKAAQEAGKGAQLISKIKGFLAAKNILQAKNFDKAVKLVKYGIKVYVVASAAKDEIELFSKEFDSDFENKTTKKVAEYVNANFGPEGRRYIQRRWALYHLNFMFEADAWATAQNVVSAASVADPTGLSGVVSAYLHPVCKDNVPPPPPRPRLLYDR